MGAYNWLRAVVECYRCGHRFAMVLQVAIGWCRYDEYAVGDAIVWMTTEERARAAERNRAVGELRTMVEVGSPASGDFAISMGDCDECPHCGATGSILAVVEANVFRRVIFTPRRIEYGTILPEDVLGQLLNGSTDHTGRELRQ